MAKNRGEDPEREIQCVAVHGGSKRIFSRSHHRHPVAKVDVIEISGDAQNRGRAVPFEPDEEFLCKIAIRAVAATSAKVATFVGNRPVASAGCLASRLNLALLPTEDDGENHD
ncbi:hypothetical protein PJL15_00892 [Paenarthrobacter nitroguajacolicus]|nr:hypothetical protein [Paenarthrobacter nitroguajacolicus]